MATEINANTSKGNALLQRANVNCGVYLHEVYGRFSEAKRKAWEWCAEQCAKENGWGFHICGHNSNTFTVAWETAEGVRMETRDNSYLIKQ